MKKSKRIISFAAAFVMIAAINVQPAGTIMSDIIPAAGITANAETAKSFNMPCEYGSWDFDVILGSKSSDGYYYNAKLTLTGLRKKTKASTDIIIPETVNYNAKIGDKEYKLKNAKIISIGESAMSDENITSISIPASVTEIGQFAFALNYKLTTVSFKSGSQLKTIKANAFNQCTSLTSITLPNSLKTIEDYAFCTTQSLKSITIPSGVSSFSDNCLEHSNITSINCNLNLIDNMFCFLKNLKQLKTINGESLYSGDTLNSKYLNLVLKSCNEANIGDVTGLDVYMDNYLNKLVQDLTRSCKNDFQKVKILADWIANRVSYDTDEFHIDRNGNEVYGDTMDKNHCDYSIFFNNKSVCEGIARGYYQLLTYAGIDTYLVCSNDHKHLWNMVEINGNMYQVDATRYINNNRDTKYLHIEDDTFSSTDKNCYFYSYDKHTTISYTQNLDLHIIKNYNQKIVHDIECMNYLGDGNLDGKVDRTDLQLLSTYVMNHNKRTGIKLLGAFDINGDNKVDQSDLAKMNEYINNKSSSTTLMEDYYMFGK